MLLFPYRIVFLSRDIVFVLANSVATSCGVSAVSSPFVRVRIKRIISVRTKPLLIHLYFKSYFIRCFLNDMTSPCAPVYLFFISTFCLFVKANS